MIYVAKAIQRFKLSHVRIYYLCLLCHLIKFGLQLDIIFIGNFFYKLHMY